MIENLRRVVGVKDVLALHFGTVVHAQDLLLSRDGLLLLGPTRARTKNRLVNMVAEVLSIHRSLHITLASHSQILVVNIADVADRVVVVVMVVLGGHVGVSPGNLGRLLGVLQQDLLVLQDLSLQVLDRIVVSFLRLFDGLLLVDLFLTLMNHGHITLLLIGKKKG